MKRNLFYLLTVITLLATLVLPACEDISPSTITPTTSIPSTAQDKEPTEPVSTPIEPSTSYPLKVTDDLGREITIDKMPERIVSLAPSNTEMLFSLGLDDRIVGVTDYCNYPEEAVAKPRVASYQTPNMEKLISVRPDIIFAEAYHEKTVLPALEKLSLTVVVSSAISKDTILYDIEMFGKINNKQKEAADLLQELKEKINAISSKTQNLSREERPSVLHIIWFQPIWTMGSNTYINDLIYLAGGTNVFADEFEGSRIVSLESIITANPQIIIVTGMATAGDAMYNAVKSETRLNSIDAIKNNRLYKFSNADLIERPSPRIALGLQELARLIQPEIFGAIK